MGAHYKHYTDFYTGDNIHWLIRAWCVSHCETLTHGNMKITDAVKVIAHRSLASHRKMGKILDDGGIHNIRKWYMDFPYKTTQRYGCRGERNEEEVANDQRRFFKDKNRFVEILFVTAFYSTKNLHSQHLPIFFAPTPVARSCSQCSPSWPGSWKCPASPFACRSFSRTDIRDN